MSHKKYLLILLVLITIGAFFRFYNLDWGAPYYFHPDERNIASSISQLHFPNQMNPHFFAYGSFPLYITYFTGFVINQFTSCQTLGNCDVSFEQAIIIGRFYSALLSLLLIPLLFFIGKNMFNASVGILTAFFATFSVGLIQFAHFSTFEIWLTFLTLCLLYFCIKIIRNAKLKYIFLAAFITGILIAVKISSIILLVLPLFSICIAMVTHLKHKEKKIFLKFLVIVIYCVVLCITSLVTFTMYAPFTFLDQESFFSSLNYESSVALGTLPVFYSGEFFNTVPILFHIIRIYPFLLNPLITILCIPSLLYFFYKMLKHRSYPYMLLTVFFIILFISQAFLFVKWTRYVLPTIPILYLIGAASLVDLSRYLSQKNIFNNYAAPIFAGILYSICFICAVSYFITVYVQEDTRISAVQFAYKNIPHSAKILSEVYDLGIVPFNSKYQSITLFNFYDLDQGVENDLNELLNNSDYIILPSQRILKTRLINPKKFPRGNAFYSNLNTNSNFEKTYETPCDVFCTIAYVGSPVFALEETANVFDRPTVFIFKKIK